MGVVCRVAASCDASAAPRSCRSAVSRPRRGCWFRSSTDRNYSAQTQFYKGTIFNDSYGAGKILQWLFTGELFDHGHFPIFSLLVAVGFVVCVIRAPALRSRRARARRVDVQPAAVLRARHLGVRSVVNVLPGNGDLQMHRFMAGVDLAAIFLAGDRPRGRRATHRRFGLGVGRSASCRRRGTADRRVDRGRRRVRRRSSRRRGPTARDYDRVRRGAHPVPAGVRSRRRRQLRSVGEGSEATRWRPHLRRHTRQLGRATTASARSRRYAEVEDYNADSIGYPFRTVQSLSTDVDASF